MKRKHPDGSTTNSYLNPPISSSVANPQGNDFEVFLSFRGPDTRTAFTDHLYTSLKNAGIRAFRDDEELRVGEEIGGQLLEAINRSKIFIPIFSKNYASSKWCLKEVAHAMKFRNTNKRLVLPIFYDVRPDDVKLQSETYKEALEKHLKLHGKETVQDWRAALAEIGGLKGWEKQKFADGHEGALVKEVVSRVWRELKKAHLLVTDYITGVEDRVEEVIKLLKVGGGDVRMVILHGIGGIGKTTLAKIVYNQLLDHFECCSFLKDIRETTSQPKGLEKLQAQLVTDALKPVNLESEFANIEEGIKVLSERLQGKKVLILLDDVDQKNQIDALAAKGSWFGNGSRIIITSRSKEWLDKSELAEVYGVEGLPFDEALVLFSKHAFRRDSLVHGFIDLSKKIVSLTGGLPLALEVIGSFLSGEPKRKWETTLKMLQKRPDEKVEDKLIISYEALRPEEKQIFLDIACFFIGSDWKIAAHMWNAREFSPDIQIEVLIARSLIKLRDGDKLWMHDQLRDLGREIIRRENIEELGKRSRLWRNEDTRDVLLSQKGTKKIVAMSLEYGFGVEGNHFESKCFRKLSNLRYLRLSNVDLKGDFDPLLPRLSWLHWAYCPEEFQASGLRLNNLLVLELSESHITDGWGGWSSMQMDVKLKALILQSCGYVYRMPNLSGFSTLETLTLENCRNLKYIDPSIGKLEKLIFLSLKNCSELKGLPQELSYLQELIELHIDGSGLEELPTLGGLEKLELLSAKNCMHLSQIPQSVDHLTSLSKLLLDGSGVCTLPNSIGALVKLTCLSLRGCESLGKLPDSIGELKSLEVLLVDRTKITNLPSTLGMLNKLEVLDTSFCTSLSVIETLCPLTTLKLNHSSIEMLPMSISQSSRLETLDLIECHALRTLPQFPNSLQSLSVTCRSIETFPNLSNSTILMELRLSLCSELKNIPGLGSLIFLKTLIVSGCSELAKLDGLKELKCLRKLDIAFCKSLQSLPDLSALKMLSHLSFVECEKLSMLEELGGLESLEHLKIEGCEAIESLPDLSKLEKLKRLFLVRCMKLKELQGLERLKSLRRVNIGYSSSLYHYTKKWPHIPWDDLPRTIGIQSHMRGAMDLLEFGAVEVKVVGICAMGGFGKSTLLRRIYGQLSEHFAYHSLISNIPETLRRKEGLIMLQRRLLLDIVKSIKSNPKKLEFSSVGEGSNVLNQRLRNKRVLIVLDDIPSISEFTALVPNVDVLAPGSRIFIASRDRHILDECRVKVVYEVPPMEPSESLAIFCKHAFKRNTSPPPDFITLSERITLLIGGHILGLKVIACFLRGKDKTVWTNSLEKIQSERVMSQGIKGMLRMCYDTLRDEEKQIFLDIACFLNETDKRIAIHMWEDCKLSPEESLTELAIMYLTRIRDDNTFDMHGELRDFGREIVQEESYREPGKRSRLWQTEVARGVFDDQKGTEKIEAICLDYETGSEDCCFASEKFKSLSNLRYLQLNKGNIVGDFNSLLPELRWLHWHHCPVELMATNLYLKKLVILDLSKSDITDDWNGWSFMQMATNLKVLLLESCRNLTKTPYLSSFPMLERLYLDGCTRLNHLDPSIGDLKNLVFLSVKGCYSLVKDQMPQVLSSLKASTKLCVDGP